jgi:hypothetical protein
MLDKTPQANNDVAAAEAKAEGQKLEYGPCLGYMSDGQLIEKIEELNINLSPQEKKWRLPTLDELKDAVDNNKITITRGMEASSYFSLASDDDHSGGVWINNPYTGLDVYYVSENKELFNAEISADKKSYKSSYIMSSVLALVFPVR